MHWYYQWSNCTTKLQVTWSVDYMLTSTRTLMFPKAKAENCVAFDPGTRLVRPWKDPKTATSASMYSPHPLKVYALPSRVVIWGSPQPHAAYKKQQRNFYEDHPHRFWWLYNAILQRKNKNKKQTNQQKTPLNIGTGPDGHLGHLPSKILYAMYTMLHTHIIIISMVQQWQIPFP